MEIIANLDEVLSKNYVAAVVVVVE